MTSKQKTLSLGGHRETSVTARRTKADFVHFGCGLLDGAYRSVTKLHLVLDNLNTHFRGSVAAVLGAKAAAVLDRFEFHHTPKHASWLNLAEIELGIMERQCTGRRRATSEILAAELHAWPQHLNDAKAGLHWSSTRQDAAQSSADIMSRNLRVSTRVRNRGASLGLTG